jgi:hypothetical protein
LARPERFELPTTWFVARYSIQLSYGRFEDAGFCGFAPALSTRLSLSGRPVVPAPPRANHRLAPPDTGPMRQPESAMSWLDKIPLGVLALLALLLGLAPFVPEPHLWEKLKMLAAGTLSRPIDIFDLLLHAGPVVALVLKLARMAAQRGTAGKA